MFTLRRLSIAAVVLALAPATPAAAAAGYDPSEMKGLIDAADVRDAFGWTDATLADRAPGVVFDHEFWTNDTYTVTCGGPAFPVVHHKQFGRYELAATVVRSSGRGTSAGYAGKAAGFRIEGARFGISGTSVPPATGQPCPEDRGGTIDRADLASTATGWALNARSGDDRRELRISGSR